MSEKPKTANSKIVRQRRIFLLTVFPAMQLVLMAGLMYGNESLKDPRFLLFCAVIAIAFVCSCVLMVKVINDTQRLEDMKREVEYLQYEQDADKRYYELAKINEKYLADFKEEIKDHIEAALSLFEHQDEVDKESAERIIGELKQKSEGFARLKYCENKIVNTVISLKTIEAREVGIDVDIEVDVDESLPISQTDLCSVFSNLYDNAIEASREVKTDVPIFMRAKGSEGYFVVKVKNAKKSDDIDQNRRTVGGADSVKGGKKFFSTKEDRHKHGYGLDIVKDISLKYSGYLDIREEGDSFEVVTALKI